MSKIIIADDDPFLIKIYSTKLSQEGHDVIPCNDGQEALEKITSESPDLVLLDVMLPRLNGLDVLASMQEEKKTKNIPVVFLSNLAQDEEQEAAKKNGAAAYLIKARYTPSQVIEALQPYLNKPSKKES